MKNKFQRLLQDRKTLYLFLSIVAVAIFSLSVAYAALNTVLEIHGNSEIVASTWDIHLENAKLKDGSVVGASYGPNINGNNVSFGVDLSIPGDYFEFSVDVVNNGSIDAMIDSVVKTPELTAEQAKYIKYEVTYENGESISSKHVIKSKNKTTIRVRIEYRKDLNSSDLPENVSSLNLNIRLIYVQSDGTGSVVSNSEIGKVINVVSGMGTQVGDEVCIGEECFYVMSNDSATVTMLSKYNLHVGNFVDQNWDPMPLQAATGIQDETAVGYAGYDNYPWIGVTAFSNDRYWIDPMEQIVKGEYGYSNYAYVYDSNSLIYPYVDNYKSYLNSMGVAVNNARLISTAELTDLGCLDTTCSGAPKWVYSTSYWTGSLGGEFVRRVYKGGGFDNSNYHYDFEAGVRPVIEISATEF